jgi:hypothetical protein
MSEKRTLACHCPFWRMYNYAMSNDGSTLGVIRIRFTKKLIGRVIQIESSTGYCSTAL